MAPSKDDIETWLRLGRLNPWIRGASDPPFTEASFHHCKSLAELQERLANRNWAVGHAETYKDACFIQQVTPGDPSQSSNCGDEWLVIRYGYPFDSVIFHQIIADGMFGAVIGKLLSWSARECERTTPDMYLRG